MRGIGLIDRLPAILENKNVQAFLKVIRFCEGTLNASGYYMMFGYNRINSTADHPKQFFSYTNLRGEKLRTSAAGAYQITYTNWKDIKSALPHLDFTPQSQDAAAIWILDVKRNALDDIKAGRFEKAINKLGNEWASLPSANSSQPRKSLTECKNVYKKYGGQIAI